MSNVYTVGNRVNYDKNLLRFGEKFQKLGRREGYPGGFALSSVEDAKRLRQQLTMEKEWAVYELEAVWGVDTQQSENGWWHSLINDSRILRRVDE
jgi:hypothetical protein